jgi:hopanoid biosynthesis associated RND transporter like protein HpnN
MARVKEEPELGRRQRALMALARFVSRRAIWIVALAFLSAGASVVYTLLELEFITDRNALVAPEAEYNQRFLRFNEEFGDQELMLLMVAPAPGPVDNPGYNPSIPGERTRHEMKLAAAAVVEKLRRKPEYFPVVIDRVDPEDFGGTRMLYLPREDLQSIELQVQGGRPLINQLAEDPSYASMLLGMREGIEEGGTQNVPDAQLDRAGKEMATLLQALHNSLAAPTGEPAMTNLFAFESTDPTLDEDGYFFAWEGRLLFVAIRPTRDPGALNQIQQPLAYAREVVAEVQAAHPDLAIGLSGRPVIYSDEMAASSEDMTIATIFAVVAVGLMFVIAFRSILRPLLAVVCLLIALCWTIGATTLLIGHLNIFAMVFGVVLVGLGIDFGIHFLAHYRDGLRRGLGVRDSMIVVYREIGMGTVLGAVTTAVALATAAFTDFLGLAELGIICGIGIMLCLVAMLVVFPAMLAIADMRRVGEGDPTLRDTIAQHEAAPLPPQRQKFMRFAALGIVLVVLASIGVSAYEYARGYIPFDYNLLELNDPSGEGVHWENLLIQHDQRSSYAVSTSHSLEELREYRAAYENMPAVIRSTESILPENEAAKREVLQRLHAALPAQFADPGKAGTAKELRSAARKLQAALKDLQTRGERMESAFAPAAEQLQRIVDLTSQREAHVNNRLAEVEPEFFRHLVSMLRALKRDSDPPPVTAATLPPVLRSRYVGADAAGNTVYALYLYPAKNAWVRENAGEFNEAVLAVDPQATGVTIQIHESGTLIAKGFAASVLYALGAIVVLLFLDLRRPLALLIALVPLVCALAILLGVMTLTALSFNFANFFAVPILIGTTIDAGVYLVHSQRHGDAQRTVKQTRRACMLCGLTTLLGFGSLITAGHRGVVSLGLVLSIGCLAGIFASYFVVPAILGWFNERGKRV